MYLHTLKSKFRHGGNWVDIGNDTKALFYKCHMIKLFSKGRFHGAPISVSIVSHFSHKAFQLKMPALYTEYLTINISICL